MEYKNQTENRAFQEMLLAAVKRLQNRSGEEIAAKSGAVFHSSRNVLEVLSFYETIEIQLPEFRINSNMDEWHYLTLLHYLDMADGTEGSQKLITFGNLKDGLIRGTKFDRTAEQKLEKLLQDKDPEKIQKACKNLGAELWNSSRVAVSLSADPGIMGEGLMGKELSEKPDAIENLTEFLLSI